MASVFQGREWTFFVPWFFSRIPPLFKAEPLIMVRRSPNGSWNYRIPTEDERLEWFELRQW